MKNILLASLEAVGVVTVSLFVMGAIYLFGPFDVKEFLL